ncbi:MAG: hypothetical protein GWP19_00830 [Planctomycetia bacterium]|nr:hypothetical protein [Planctomycetia bacterium]
MRTYKINNRIYNETEDLTLNFKIGLQNIQTLKNLWSKLYESFKIGKYCEIFNSHKAKEVEVSGTVKSLVEILFTLGHNPYIFNKMYGYINSNECVLQFKYRPKGFISRGSSKLPEFQVYKPGQGWRFVANTPVICPKQIISHGKIYRRYNLTKLI